MRLSPDGPSVAWDAIIALVSSRCTCIICREPVMNQEASLFQTSRHLCQTHLDAWGAVCSAYPLTEELLEGLDWGRLYGRWIGEMLALPMCTQYR